MYNNFYKSDSEKHNVFISYYHKGNQKYRDEFETLFGHLFINKSVEDGDIDSDNSDEYIKHLIQEDYIKRLAATPGYLEYIYQHTRIIKRTNIIRAIFLRDWLIISKQNSQK